MSRKQHNRCGRAPLDAQRGFTLVEVMVSMTISLLMLAALVGMFVNTSRNNDEIQKMNGMIENGRFAVQLLQDDIAHAGYWAGYVPQFDDLSFTAVPTDVPAAVPDVCAAYNTWDQPYRSALLGIPVQASANLPACFGALPKRADTDVLVVRHADTCAPGAPNCGIEITGRLYFQTSFCTSERNAGTVAASTANSLTLSSNASAEDGAYAGLTIRTADQANSIAAYDGDTKVATMSTLWTTLPAIGSPYAFEYVLGTTEFPLHLRNCVGTGTPSTLPITAGALAEKRWFVSNIYYIHDYPHPDRAGEVIPTLVRSQFDLSGGLAHQPPVPLIGGIEALRVELGIDDTSDSGEPVDYTTAVDWLDSTKASPTNRGDGQPDQFIRCTTAVPCTAAQLSNVVAVKLYLLSRSRDITPGHTDSRSYCLGEYNADGTCPVENTIPAANDNYKRHVFTTSVRLNNISGRRETPS